VRVDDRLLPRLERDHPVVLAAGTVLGEGFRPAWARRDDADALRVAYGVAADAPAQARCENRPGGRFDHARIAGIARDDELQRTLRNGDAAVAEVQAQEVGICVGVIRSPHLDTNVCSHRVRTESAHPSR
jgi:hypothetical protein